MCKANEVNMKRPARKDIQYYIDLWQIKSKGLRGHAGSEPRQRPGLIDRLFPPWKYGRSQIAAELLTGSSGKVLDIGCWGGDSLVSMGAMESFDDIFGIDLIDESVNKAITRGIKAYKCNLNEEPLPFSVNKFDAVTCLAVLGQLFDPYFALAEIRRVLKPSGVLIVNVPNVASLSNRIRLLTGRLPVTSRDPGWDGAQLHYFTLSEVKNFLEKGGFRVEAVKASGSPRWPRQLWPSLLSGTLTFKALKL
jgi:methionine biosynthesis protein MetW